MLTSSLVYSIDIGFVMTLFAVVGNHLTKKIGEDGREDKDRAGENLMLELRAKVL